MRFDVPYDKLYVTPDEIRAWLGLEDEEKLSDEILVDLIMEKMEYVDNITDTTWNGRIRKAREIHDIGKWKGGFWWGAGVEIPLAKRFIRAFEKINVLWTTIWENFVVTRREGRNIGDWWADYDNGVLYLKAWVIYQGGREVVVEYYYGSDRLPFEIRELTKLLVIRDLIWRDFFAFAIPDGANASLRYRELLDQINDRILYLEELYRSVKPAQVVVKELGEFSELPDIPKCCGMDAEEEGSGGESGVNTSYGGW